MKVSKVTIEMVKIIVYAFNKRVLKKKPGKNFYSREFLQGFIMARGLGCMVIMNLGEYKPMNMHTESNSGACWNLECLKKNKRKKGWIVWKRIGILIKI